MDVMILVILTKTYQTNPTKYGLLLNAKFNTYFIKIQRIKKTFSIFINPLNFFVTIFKLFNFDTNCRSVSLLVFIDGITRFHLSSSFHFPKSSVSILPPLPFPSNSAERKIKKLTKLVLTFQFLFFLIIGYNIYFFSFFSLLWMLPSLFKVHSNHETSE